MTERAWLGIDCGTQSTKAILLSEDGTRSLGLGRADHAIDARNDGTREQHPDMWLRAAALAVRQAIATCGDVEVAGIGVSGQQHGLVCLDGRDRPVRPAKLWNDTTTVDECALLTERLGGPDRVLSLTGNLFLTSYTAPKVLWLERHEPAAYARTRRLCLPHDLLDLWLTGAYVTEAGDASGTAYVDARARAYQDEVLAAIDPSRDWAAALPPISRELTPIGRLRDEAARELGLAGGIPVATGGGDNMCAAIGVGAVTEGPVIVSLGTSGTAFAYSRSPAIDPQGEAAAFCDSTGGWLPLVCTLNCTVATEWARDLLGMDHGMLDDAVRLAPAGAGGLTFIPHLEGERTPDHPEGAGVLIGLRARHGREEVARAVVEGITFGLRYALGALTRAGVQAREITLVGGGAASDAWAQMVADVFELPVQRPALIEAAATGAALQARWTVTGERPPAAREGDRFEPRTDEALREAAARADRVLSIALRNAL